MLDCNKFCLSAADWSITQLSAGNVGRLFPCIGLRRTKPPPQKHLPNVTSPLCVPCLLITPRGSSHPSPTCREASPFPRKLRSLLFEAGPIGLALCFPPKPASHPSLREEEETLYEEKRAAKALTSHPPLVHSRCLFQASLEEFHMRKSYSGGDCSTV